MGGVVVQFCRNTQYQPFQIPKHIARLLFIYSEYKCVRRIPNRSLRCILHRQYALTSVKTNQVTFYGGDQCCSWISKNELTLEKCFPQNIKMFFQPPQMFFLSTQKNMSAEMIVLDCIFSAVRKNWLKSCIASITSIKVYLTSLPPSNML